MSSSWLVRSHNYLQDGLGDIGRDVDNIEKKVYTIEHQLNDLLEKAGGCAKEVDLQTLLQMVAGLVISVQNINTELTNQGEQIAQILAILTPNPAASFSAEVISDD
jgi:uncharacterized protein YoxC